MNGEPEEVPPPTHPMAAARHLAIDWHTPDGHLRRRRWRGTWMDWTGTAWREIDELQVRSELYERLEHATYIGQGQEGEPKAKDWAPNKTKISNLLDALVAITYLPTATDAPSWLDGSDRGPIVACENGLLRVTDGELLPHTPEFFNLGSVPYAYDPHAAAPSWEAFLAGLWPSEPDAVAALQEWFGYVLSGATDQQKILLIYGPPRSGKGTIARVLAALVGQENMAGPTLAGLGTNFGLSTLVGKSLALIADARLTGTPTAVTERLLTISGEDCIDVDRKYREPWTGKLGSRLMLLSNELPDFGDSSGVIASRFIVLHTARSWLGREDPTLGDRLAAEMPGILNWALAGLARLRRQGRLTQPAASRDAITTMQDTASPTTAFVRECCTTGPTATAPVDEVWQAWKRWAEDNGIRCGTKQILGRNLQSVIPELRRTKPRGDDGRQVATYTGLALNS